MPVGPTKHNSFDIWLVIILLPGLIVRLLLAHIPGFGVDVGDFSAWAVLVHSKGVGQIYNNYFIDYPPVYLYILAFLDNLKELFSLTNTKFLILLKIPSILSETLLALLIYSDLKRINLTIARLGAILISLNPALIFNSSIWGQIDGFLALLCYFSFYLLRKGQFLWSGVLIALSIFTKPQALVLLLPFTLYLTTHLKRIPWILSAFLITTFIIFIPFLSNHSIVQEVTRLIKASSEYPYTSLFAFNIWGAVGFWILDSTKWLTFTYRQWGLISFIVYMTLVSLWYLKHQLSLLSLLTLSTLAFFFLPTMVHERYLYLGLIFLIASSLADKDRLLIGLSIALSIIHFYELLVVYNAQTTHQLLFPTNIPNGLFPSLISTTIFIIVSVRLLMTSKRLQTLFKYEKASQ